MQDAMTIWDSICHSQWFKQTSIVSLRRVAHMPALSDLQHVDLVLEQGRLIPEEGPALGY